MKALHHAWYRFVGLFRRGAHEAQMAEEIRAHVDALAARNRAAGMAPDEARAAALRTFGGVEQIKERCRDARTWPAFEQVRQDVRHAVRVLLKAPIFSSVAILSLALGIGANTAVFSLVNAILLGSLPVPNPQDLRCLKWTGTDAHPEWVSGSLNTVPATSNASGNVTLCDAFAYPTYRELRQQSATVAELFGYAELRDINLHARREPSVIGGLLVTDNFFSGLGVHALLGRVFTTGDDAPGTAPLAVISAELWTKEFAADPAVLGQTMSLNGSTYTIVGVVPPGFRGVDLAGEAAVYVPMSAQPLIAPNFSTTAPNRWWVNVMGRIRPEVSDRRLQATLEVAFGPQVASVMTQPRIQLSNGRAGPAYDQSFYRRPLLLLLGVVGIVVLVACANLAGLSLARGAARQHEFAVRAALGSGRWRLVRQSLAESMVLALIGGALGLLLAFWGKTAIGRLLIRSPEGLRYDLTLDLAVLGFTFGVTVITGILTGLLPAWRAGQVDPLAGLKSRGALASPRLGVGKILVAAQIALSVLLLTGAGLYVRTLVNLVKLNPGFATENLLLFQLNPRAAGLRGAAATEFFTRAQEAIRRIPGTRAVTLTQFKLLDGMMSGGRFFTLPSHPELTGEQAPKAHRLEVSETFFPTMGIPLLLGCGFTEADTSGSRKVAVVNQTFVKTYFPNQIPLGQTLKVGADEWAIVGVCGDAKYGDLKQEVPSTVYFSYRQAGTGRAYLAVRTSPPPFVIVTSARQAIAAINPDIPLADITTQADVRDSRLSQEKTFATLVAPLAGLAVLLACIGLYGLIAYNVTQRTGEIGVRMALGARPADVASRVLREAVCIATAGIAVGVPAALILAQLVKSQLYGVGPVDPVSLLLALGLLFTVTIAAAVIPARRAAHIDPLTALRAE